MRAMQSSMEKDTMPLARLASITKSFGGPPVVEDVTIDFAPGEVHVLAGENGAGKSTLMKILGGIVTGYQGTVEVGGHPMQFGSPAAATRAGISILHQELSLITEMSVADNLLLGVEPTRKGFRSASQTRASAKSLLETMGLDVDLDAPVKELSLSLAQLVEVAKALRGDPNVIAMDEPTSALNSQDAERLFTAIARLKEQGKAIIYISHKMDEIHRLADRITVLRDGRLIGTYGKGELTDESLIDLMVGGKKRAEEAARSSASVGSESLRLDKVSVQIGRRKVVQNASLEVRAGEVVGLAGLQGAGSSELMQAIFGGSGQIVSGEIAVNGEAYRAKDPRHAISRGIAFLTNDRKTSGLVLPLSVTENATLVSLPALSPGGWRSDRLEKLATESIAQQFRLRAPSLEAPVGSLSGGNQQKVALGKWILNRPKVLLLDEPTRGIDIGAKREIYELIQTWKAEGMAILLITSELPELLMLCDRILVMHRGQIVRTFTGQEATGEAVIDAAMGGEGAH
ncbi:sugar ABC transporter ATP-binding protein [bacterium]|nr:MAG: sugar ABC transporter ATP-binding protein [bacterium]